MNPLQSVNVLVKGLESFILTDENGYYEITPSEGTKNLLFTFKANFILLCTYLHNCVLMLMRKLFIFHEYI